ncbi:M50 family metallopeptidase [Sporosarcina luteola]|uniref:M50 family metallopeptidase n=1 Tax=Sporosarcina luteola TaxID=582850 RepID=UPI00204066C5|nr:site-2 protease family protein [Sporosarcina luteola]MCM3710775.1 M50 family metallopeptidase [Sporosarcina luteola]
MKLRLHPILAPFFLVLMFTGGLAFYALVFISLLFHEAGHIFAAKMSGMKVRSCTIMPYGGELRIPDRYAYGKSQRVAVAIGGPAATAILLLLSMLFDLPGNEQFMRIQLVILALNLLPILPLDGGQAISAMLEKEENKYKVRSAFLVYSIAVLLAVSLLLLLGLPETVLFLSLALFLLIQNISAFKFRKYEQAYEQLKRKQLTP